MVPEGVVTTTKRATAAEVAGETAVISVEDTTVKLLAGPAPPKVTAVAPVKFVPVMVTVVFPVVGPEVGEREMIVGAVPEVTVTVVEPVAAPSVPVIS